MRPAPQVSVVMPVYNGGPFLAASVESILNQTFNDFEFIIVDDGSTDTTLAQLHSFAIRDRRIRIITRPNTGIVGALNDGLRAARGSLIARMDADDVSLPQRFEQQVRFLSENPQCVGVGTALLMIDEEGDPIRGLHWTCDSQAIHEELLRGRGGLAHPTAMLRSAVVRQVGRYRPETQYAEDLDLWLRLTEVGELANLAEPLLKYRMHASSICANRRADIRRAIQRAVRDAHQRRQLPFPADTEPADWSPLLTESTFRLVANAVLGGHFQTARKHAIRRWLASPTSLQSWLTLCIACGGPVSRLGGLATQRLHSLRQRLTTASPVESPSHQNLSQPARAA